MTLIDAYVVVLFHNHRDVKPHICEWHLVTLALIGYFGAFRLDIEKFQRFSCFLSQFVSTLIYENYFLQFFVLPAQSKNAIIQK